jgi:hypothetical protein
MFDPIELGIEFFEGLVAIDEALVKRAAAEPCRDCGGPPRAAALHCRGAGEPWPTTTTRRVRGCDGHVCAFKSLDRFWLHPPTTASSRRASASWRLARGESSSARIHSESSRSTCAADPHAPPPGPAQGRVSPNGCGELLAPQPS